MEAPRAYQCKQILGLRQDRRDRRLELQMQQQTQNMQMMMMMMMGIGAMGSGARHFSSVPTMNAENVDEKNNDDEVKDA